MAFRIAPREQEPVRKGKPKKEAGYLAALHRLPCAVTGTYGVEAAHLSFPAPEYGHYGRGKGQKAPDRWALPLSAEEHRKQHSMNEREYWAETRINPHRLALVLWGLWTEHGDDFVPFAEAVIRARAVNGNARSQARL